MDINSVNTLLCGASFTNSKALNNIWESLQNKSISTDNFATKNANYKYSKSKRSSKKPIKRLINVCKKTARKDTKFISLTLLQKLQKYWKTMFNSLAESNRRVELRGAEVLVVESQCRRYNGVVGIIVNESSQSYRIAVKKKVQLLNMAAAIITVRKSGTKLALLNNN